MSIDDGPTPTSAEYPFVKGHGTGNDFVVLPDPAGALSLTPDVVARICDRRTGIGADGVLRVVRSAAFAAGAHHARQAEWFMDYRNADGSVAEMCGNGARLFARFLLDSGAVKGDFSIATRAGIHAVSVEPDGTITVEMGRPVTGPGGPPPQVGVGESLIEADAWWLPNPHAVVIVDDFDSLGDALDVPRIEAGNRFPDGQNVEYVLDQSSSEGDLHARMRVYERGVGETLSSGTGACAAALSLCKRHQVAGPATVTVDVPGGQLTVSCSSDGNIYLNGPAVIVGRGTLDPLWWEGNQ